MGRDGKGGERRPHHPLESDHAARSAGAVFPINPKRPNVMGDQGLSVGLGALPGSRRPGGHRHARRRRSPAIVAECVEAGVRAAIVISAGFKEIGPEGKKLEDEILPDRPAPGIRVDRPELPRG
ncbi:MAG: hypothetical protein MZV49_00340 [Rhodopseudomonas palustris]|nr:hypothetical protein [Rhodopseudomonas palustris]